MSEETNGELPPIVSNLDLMNMPDPYSGRVQSDNDKITIDGWYNH